MSRLAELRQLAGKARGVTAGVAFVALMLWPVLNLGPSVESTCADRIESDRAGVEIEALVAFGDRLGNPNDTMADTFDGIDDDDLQTLCVRAQAILSRCGVKHRSPDDIERERYEDSRDRCYEAPYGWRDC